MGSTTPIFNVVARWGVARQGPPPGVREAYARRAATCRTGARRRTMPAFEKSPPELVARFEAAAERFPEAQRRKMFGYPALFVGGNLVTGLFADSWMIRLGEADLAEIMALPDAA